MTAREDRRLRADFRVLWVLVVALTVGCQRDTGPLMGHVTGIVSYQGKPLVKARVTFQPTTKGTPAAIGVTDTAGKYSLSTFGKNDGAIVGPCKIAVELRAPFEGTVPESMNAAVAAAEFADQGKPLIPEKYFSSESSGLSAEVKPGLNTLDLSLRD